MNTFRQVLCITDAFFAASAGGALAIGLWIFSRFPAEGYVKVFEPNLIVYAFEVYMLILLVAYAFCRTIIGALDIVALIRGKL